MVSRITRRCSAESSSASGSAARRRGGSDHMFAAAGASGGLKRSGSTLGPVSCSAIAENGISRRSRSALVFARFVRMRKIQVLRDERRSNRSMPWSTASQVSCATSSATARSRTKVCASRTSAAWWRSTSSWNALSSPACSASTSRSSSPAGLRNGRRGTGAEPRACNALAGRGDWPAR